MILGVDNSKQFARGEIECLFKILNSCIPFIINNECLYGLRHGPEPNSIV